MIEYDLSATPLFRNDDPQPPSELELIALTFGLLTSEVCTFADLLCRPLVLTAENCASVAALIEARLPALARELGKPAELRHRLRRFIGLRVRRSV